MNGMNVRIYNHQGELITVPMFQLLQWKYAIGLEMKGLKFSRGSVTAHVRKRLSAPRSYKRADLHQHICDSIESIQAQLDWTNENDSHMKGETA
jgi:hypothetical protein